MADRIIQLIDSNGNNVYPVVDADGARITVTDTDPGEGAPLATNHFIAVYGEVTSPESYSLSEIETDATWIDGKTIYKKTINFGTLPNNTTKRVLHGISNIDRVVKVEQSISNAPSGAFHGFIFISSGNAANTQFNFWGTDTEICVTTTSDRSAQTAYITLYYTKQ